MAAKKKGLGRGLGALIQDGTPEKPETTAPAGTGSRALPIEQVRRSPLQPRTHFEAEPLDELTASIRETGIIQPLVVRPKGDHYEVIAGERRLRAAGQAGLTEVPVVIVDVDDQKALEMALIENLQRENLDPIEEAEGYARLAADFSLTQEAIATRVGKGRPTVANSLRLLELPESIRTAISNGRLSAGHAKVLSALPDATQQEAMAVRVAEEQLSVRKLESLVRQMLRGKRRKRVTRTDLPDHHVRFLADRLHQHFGTAVQFHPSSTYSNGKKSKGHIRIDYFSSDELDRILSMMGVTLDD